MIIDCDSCEVRGKACGDCVVSFMTIPVRPGTAPPHPPVPPSAQGFSAEPAMDGDQRRAVDLLIAGGLVPPLRHAEPVRTAQQVRSRAS